MRIVSATTFATSVDTLQQRQQDLSLAQDRLTSGKRVSRASDDPAAAARVERALAATSRSIADQRALEASRNAMQQAEGALGDATGLMQQVRELVVAAGNGSYTAAERLQLGLRIAGLRDSLLAVANRSDGAGGYLFGGPGLGAAAVHRWRGRGAVSRRRRPDHGARRRVAADDPGRAR